MTDPAGDAGSGGGLKAPIASLSWTTTRSSATVSVTCWRPSRIAVCAALRVGREDIIRFGSMYRMSCKPLMVRAEGPSG